MRRAAKLDHNLGFRLAGVSDLIAAESKNVLCYRQLISSQYSCYHNITCVQDYAHYYKQCLCDYVGGIVPLKIHFLVLEITLCKNGVLGILVCPDYLKLVHRIMQFLVCFILSVILFNNNNKSLVSLFLRFSTTNFVKL